MGGERNRRGRREGCRKRAESPSKSLLFLNVWNCKHFYNIESSYCTRSFTWCGNVHCHDYQIKWEESALPVGPSLTYN